MEEMGRLIMSGLLEFYKDKKVLMTGHTGFKGAWLSRILVQTGADVTGYSLEAPTNPNLFGLADVENQMKSVIGDIRDREHLLEVFEETQPEIVIHLAAQPIVRDSYKNPVYTYETNVMGTVNICEAVRLNPCVKSFLLPIRYIKIMSGNGDIERMNHWMDMILIPIVSPAQNL